MAISNIKSEKILHTIGVPVNPVNSSGHCLLVTTHTRDLCELAHHFIGPADPEYMERFYIHIPAKAGPVEMLRRYFV